MTDASYLKWLALMEQLGGVLDQLTGLARETIEATKKADLEAVNDCMKRQQALSLSLRSMDIQREKVMAEMGLPGGRLSNVVSHCPTELRPQAAAAEERLRTRYKIYQATAGSARKLLESDLHLIETHMGRSADDSGLTDFRA